jgi:hypothetical protein
MSDHSYKENPPEIYCCELAQEGRQIYCKVKRAQDPEHKLATAPCMLDKQAWIFIDAKLCENFTPMK